MSLRQREESHDRPLRILSVDGGGAKGLNAIIVLKALERECGQPLNEMFDYIAGTSIGGAIANSVAKEAYSLDKAEDFIEQVCTSAPLPSPLTPSAQAASHFFSPLTPFRYPPSSAAARSCTSPALSTAARPSSSVPPSGLCSRSTA